MYPYFSINRAMFNSTNGKNIINRIPSERILLESDYPFVKINNKPFSVTEIDKVIELLAKNRNCDTDEMHFQLNNNFRNIIKNNY